MSGAARAEDDREQGAFRASGALFLFGLAVAVARNPGAVLEPPMAFEDGFVLFQHYYGGVGLADLFVFYGGYVSVVPNLVGFIACLLPTEWIPLALGVFPLCITAAVPVATARLLRDFGVGNAAAVAVAASTVVMPLGGAEIQSVSIYSYCHLLFFSVVWSIGHLCPGARTRRSWWLLAPLCMASHPLSVAVVPVYALGFWQQRSPEAGARLAYVSAVALGYVVFGMQGIAPAEGGGAGLAMLGATLSTWLGRVWFEVFFGGVARAALWEFSPGAVWGLGATLLGLVAALLVRASRREHQEGSEARSAMAVAFAYTLLLTGMVVVTRWDTPAASLENFMHGRRYLHVQQLLVVLLTGWGLTRTLPAQAFSRLARGALAVWLVLMNINDAFYYKSSETEGGQARAYVAELARLEAAGRRGRLSIERGEWSLDVEVR